MKMPCFLLAVFLCGASAFAGSVHEHAYAFRNRLEVVHESGHRDLAAVPRVDEFVFVDGCRVPSEDFADYLRTSMGVQASVGEKGVISVLFDRALREREYEVDVSASGVVIRAYDERARDQALYHLEDLMNLRRAPFLAFGHERRRMCYSPRMTHSGWGLDKFPDAHLRQLAHQGFDAILLFLTGVDETQGGGKSAGINDIIDRAFRIGLDTYLYSKVPIFAHPDGSEGARKLREAFGAIAAAHPKAKGIVFVGESAEFPSRDERTCGLSLYQERPKGENRPLPGWYPCRDYPDWLKAVQSALREKSSGLEVVFWTYNWSDCPPEQGAELLKRFPPDVAIESTFAPGESHRYRNGLEVVAKDYTLSVPGPNRHFEIEAAAAAAGKRKLYAMSNTGGLTWDYGVVPYQPNPYQWKRRWDALRATSGLVGLMESHHYGCWPSFITEMAKEAFTEGGIPFDEHLRKIAMRDFGEGNVETVLSVWKAWSEAAADYVATNENQYGPFRLGPAYPFNFSGKPIGEGEFPQGKDATHVMRWMAYLNYLYDKAAADSLNITYESLPPADREKDLELLRSMREKWMSGANRLREIACNLCNERRRQNAVRMADLGEWHARTISTAIALRRGQEAFAADDRKALVAIAAEERKNAVAALELAERDSRLGWEPSMEYVGGPEQIRWKIALIDRLYGSELAVVGLGSCPAVDRFSRAGFWDVPESPRKTVSFNRGWEFSLDGFKTAKSVSLPHCIDEGEIGFNASGCVNRQQPAWYRKRFAWKRTHARAFLHFEAVMGKCEIDVNGKRVAAHFGGHLPIHVDVTDALRDGENEVVVRCDNSNDPTYPPGLPQKDLDFTYFGGIYRDVWLVETGEAYVADPGSGGVFVDTRLGKDGKWTVSADVTLGGETNDVSVRLTYDGHEVCSPFQPADPSVWSPDNPNLHFLRVDVLRSGHVVDSVGVRFGIRDFEMRREGFFLNGRKYPKKLIGVNRHQDYLFIGNAMPNSLHWRDVKKFKDAGMTIFRSAHYPQDPGFMDACDELGMFVIDATPGWHFWDDSTPLFGERVADDIVQMVRRDRSRPSLLLWEPILNETEFPRSFATNALALVKRETRGRGWCTCDSISEGANAFDVNYQFAQTDHGKPQFCREWGDFPDDWDAQNSSSRVAVEWGEGPQVAQAVHYRDEKRFGSLSSILGDPDIFGGTMWHGTDHARGFHPDMFFGGILTYARRRKYSYYMLQATLSEQPVFFLAHELAPFSPSCFTVFSNVPYEATWLGKPFVPGQTPFVYDDLQKMVYYPDDAASVTNGVFAVRFSDGTEQRFWPAKRFDHIRLELDTEGLAPVADGSDMVALTAVLADTNGTAKRYARERIVFDVDGPADIVGENPQETRWGEATVLLRLRENPTPERIVVRARLVRAGYHVRQSGMLSFAPGSSKVTVGEARMRETDAALERIELQQRDFGRGMENE